MGRTHMPLSPTPWRTRLAACGLGIGREALDARENPSRCFASTQSQVKSLSHASLRQKYLSNTHDARQQTVASMSPISGVAFTITEWSGRTWEAMERQWDVVIFDWREVSRRYRDPDRLELAVWCDDVLLCVALVTTKDRAVVVQFVEGNPSEACPLKGERLGILLDAAANYALVRGKVEIHLEPKNDDLIALYEEVYDFERVNRKGSAPYWCRKV